MSGARPQASVAKIKMMPQPMALKAMRRQTAELWASMEAEYTGNVAGRFLIITIVLSRFDGFSAEMAVLKSVHSPASWT